MTARTTRCAAWLLIVPLTLLLGCSPGEDAGTTSTEAPSGSVAPGALPVRDELIDPQPVEWRSWRAAEDKVVEFVVTAGPAACFGAQAEVVETETEVRVELRVGRLPEAADRACPAVTLESVVPVALAADLGDRQIQPL
jgi:hypothetical protein